VRWWLLGRLAARAARVLVGKNCPDFTPHLDHREGIVVINAEKVRLTGQKLDRKIYRHYSGYPGGLKEVTARQQMARAPERLVRDAILGMLPKTRLGARLAGRLKVYAGPVHPHSAQKLIPLSLSR